MSTAETPAAPDVPNEPFVLPQLQDIPSPEALLNGIKTHSLIMVFLDHEKVAGGNSNNNPAIQIHCSHPDSLRLLKSYLDNHKTQDRLIHTHWELSYSSFFMGVPNRLRVTGSAIQDSGWFIKTNTALFRTIVTEVLGFKLVEEQKDLNAGLMVLTYERRG